jgi:hypothetical protein
MCTISYYKLGSQWFLDLPEYLEHGSAADLERIGSFHDFLQLAAAGNDSLQFEMSTTPFEGADSLVFSGSSGEQTGAYYHLHSFRGTVVDLELWYNNILFYFLKEATMPPNLYIKLLS